MSATVRSMLRAFAQLTKREQDEFTSSFMRCLAAKDWPALTDDQLTQIADEAFVRMDLDERRHEKRRAR